MVSMQKPRHPSCLTETITIRYTLAVYAVKIAAHYTLAACAMKIATRYTLAVYNYMKIAAHYTLAV